MEGCAVSTEVLERPVEVDQTTQEPGKYAHYINEKGRPGIVMAAMVEGFEVEALCGYRWIPGRDPGKRPICPKCQDLYDNAPGGDRGE